MFLSKTKQFCFFLSLIALPHFEAIAGKGDLLKGATTTPFKRSSAAIFFSSHPRVFVSSATQQGALTSSGRLYSECHDSEDELPYDYTPAEGGGKIRFGAKTTLREYLDEVTLTNEWKVVKENIEKQQDAREYFKIVKKYAFVEENAREFWNFILSSPGSEITRVDLNKKLQIIAEEAELNTPPQLSGTPRDQRFAFQTLLTFDKKHLKEILERLKKEN